jgi:membrane protein DedA with SNARE-associated domain
MEHLGHFGEDLATLVKEYGVFAVFSILALESLGAPLPGETLLIFASVLVARGEMSLPGLLLSAWTGSVLGDNAGYVIGRTVGRATLTRYGAKIGLTETRMSEIERIFLRYGSVTVLFARRFVSSRRFPRAPSRNTLRDVIRFVGSVDSCMKALRWDKVVN